MVEINYLFELTMIKVIKLSNETTEYDCVYECNFKIIQPILPLMVA